MFPQNGLRTGTLKKISTSYAAAFDPKTSAIADPISAWRLYNADASFGQLLLRVKLW